jgi:hypothetical protein
MPAPTPIDRFAVLSFDDVEGAILFCQRVVDLLVSPLGIAYTLAPTRPVLWLLPPAARSRFTGRGCFVFASEGAVEAARAAELSVRCDEFIPATDLPQGCALAFGDSFVDARSTVGMTG